MLIIAGHYLVDAAQRDAYVEAYRDLVTRARAAPGCLDVAITADTVEPERVNMFERWEDEGTLAAFRAVVDPPEFDVEMREIQISKFSIDGSPTHSASRRPGRSRSPAPEQVMHHAAGAWHNVTVEAVKELIR